MKFSLSGVIVNVVVVVNVVNVVVVTVIIVIVINHKRSHYSSKKI